MTEGSMVSRTDMPFSGLIMLGLCLLLSLSLAGCGVKGPPVPPEAPPVPAVDGLSHQVDRGSVALFWDLPEGLSDNQARGSAFAIYQSRSDLAEAACEGCPLVFEKVASVPYVPTEGNRFSTTVPLDPGYRYVFKVNLEVNGQAGNAGQTVRFDFPSDGPSEGTETP